MIAGFAAALTTETGKIGYLGPLVNEETRRLAAASYLGARYAWETARGKDPADLSFKVTWIGFWFNIPGVTADPTQVAQSFYDGGHDVIISGIDTTENLVVALQKRKAGKTVWAIPYDYEGACEGGDAVCLGVPYFNWGPAYVDLIRKSMKGDWESVWLWLPPDWDDINNPTPAPSALSGGRPCPTRPTRLLTGSSTGWAVMTIQLFKGPLKYQDGSVFLKPGEVASDQKIWYMEQLLSGMEGQSSAK